MKVFVKYQYPNLSTVTIEVSPIIIIFGKSLKIAFNVFEDGIKTLDVFKNNIKNSMIHTGYITKDAEIISVEIYNK